MPKNRYRCKRYRLFLPKSIEEALETDLEYVARLIGPLVVIVRKGSDSSRNGRRKTVKGIAVEQSISSRSIAQ